MGNIQQALLRLAAAAAGLLLAIPVLAAERPIPQLRQKGGVTQLAVEGQFDFSYLDAMLEPAHEHDQRLVILWFGSWKNGVSSYAPVWVLKDTERFPRVKVYRHD